MIGIKIDQGKTAQAALRTCRILNLVWDVRACSVIQCMKTHASEYAFIVCGKTVIAAIKKLNSWVAGALKTALWHIA
jgi:hypothetical protein